MKTSLKSCKFSE